MAERISDEIFDPSGGIEVIGSITGNTLGSSHNGDDRGHFSVLTRRTIGQVAFDGERPLSDGTVPGVLVTP